MKFIFSFFCVMFLSEWLFAQADLHEAENLQKYWFYRERLVNDFMKVGPNKGESIPVMRRGKANHDEDPSCGIPQDNILVWSADPTIDLGVYIGVLATEYKLLSDNGQDVSETVEELYYALGAFDRLDYTAESYWRGGTPQSGDLNGFFIRDDVPSDFITNNYNHFNSGNYSISIVNNVLSGLSCNPPPFEGNVDQSIHLLVGLSLVSKFIDESITYNSQPVYAPGGETEISLTKAARNIADRIVSYIKTGGDIGWVVKNPVTGNCVGYNPLNNPHPCNVGASGGGNAQLLSYGFAEAACFITHEPPANAQPPISCSKYHDLFSRVGGFTIWHNLWQNLPPCNNACCDDAINICSLIEGWPFECNDIEIKACALCQEDAKDLYLAAIGSSFFECIPDCLSPIQGDINVTQSILETRGLVEHLEIIPLLHAVLHDKDISVPPFVYPDLLKAAPCHGPFNFGAPHNEPEYSYEWSVDSRFRSPEARGANGNEKNGCYGLFSGEYNGLDYMLLFNLYRIKYKDNINITYVKLDERNLFGDFPFTFTNPFTSETHTVGNHQFPLTQKAVNSISSTVHLHNDGDLIYKAEKEIHLLPGFNTDFGSTFEAKIDRYDCSPTYYDYGDGSTATAPKTGNTTNSSNEPDTTKETKLKIHNQGILITPNPTTGIFQIQVGNGQSAMGNEYKIEIYNVLGEKVTQSVIPSGARNLTIDLSSQPKGIYFMKVQSESKIYTEKVVIQ